MLMHSGHVKFIIKLPIYTELVSSMLDFVYTSKVGHSSQWALLFLFNF